jgi:hypothetical protein
LTDYAGLDRVVIVDTLGQNRTEDIECRSS